MENNYKVITSHSKDEFENQVSEHIRKGYELAGNLVVVADTRGESACFYQSVTKKSELLTSDQ